MILMQDKEQNIYGLETQISIQMKKKVTTEVNNGEIILQKPFI